MIDNEQPKDRRETHRSQGGLWVGVSVATSIAAIGVASIALFLAHWSVKDVRQVLDERTDELAWLQEVHSSYHDDNSITADVGTIQFLDNGFSIHLDRVNYSADGLELAGHVGNPTNLWVTQLTLKFRAYRPLRSRREEFMKEEYNNRWFFLPDMIGHAQASPISVLPPGNREAFQVIIPNVVQSQTESFELRVEFSGERYSYGR